MRPAVALLVAILASTSGCTHGGPIPLPGAPGWAYHPRPVVCSTSRALVFRIEPSATGLDHDVYGCVVQTTSPRQPIEMRVFLPAGRTEVHDGVPIHGFVRAPGAQGPTEGTAPAFPGR
jgi:hypothetical protein